jgi:hypothetical protein
MNHCRRCKKAMPTNVAWLRIGRGHGKGLRYYLICWECAEILADEVLHPGSSLHAGGGQ